MVDRNVHGQQIMTRSGLLSSAVMQCLGENLPPDAFAELSEVIRDEEPAEVSQ